MPRSKKSQEEKQTLKMRDIPPETFIPSGVTELDEIIGGGFPVRRITQLYGVPGSGKSWLLAMTIAKLQEDKPDANILYVDSEFALNIEHMKNIGVDVDKVEYMPDSRLETVANHIVENVKNYDLIVIDTLAKLTPITIQENDVGTNAIGLAARQIAHFEARLRPELFKSHCAIVCINQVRANISNSYGDTKPAGGFAWNHTVDLNLKMARARNNTNSHEATVKIEKSRVSIPWKSCSFLVKYKNG